MSLHAYVPDFTKELVIILNEDQPEYTAKFTVPQGFLTENSAFFKAACSNEWLEVRTHTIRIPEVDVDVFQAYLYWVYRKEITISTDFTNVDVHIIPTTFDMLAKLWLLGDRLADTKLRNTVMGYFLEAFIEVGEMADYTQVITLDTVSLICAETTESRALRRLVLDCYNYCVTPDQMKPCADELPFDFVKDLMLLKMAPDQYTDPAQQTLCHYHEHDEQHPGCADVRRQEEDDDDVGDGFSDDSSNYSYADGPILFMR